MKQSKTFWLGEIITTYRYDFDGACMEVTKFHPWQRRGATVLSGVVDTATIEYHCEAIRECSRSLLYLVIAWIAYRNLGSNHGALVSGIAKALEIIPEKEQAR